MPPWLCEAGCKRKDGTGRPERHYRSSDCPFGGTHSDPKALKAKANRSPASSTAEPPGSVPPDASSSSTGASKPTGPSGASSSRGGLNFTGGTASTEKGPGKPSLTPQDSDFIVDKPHTKTAVNLIYRGIHGICDFVDDWLNAGVEPAPIKHMPAALFKLSDAENQAIDFEERSIFARGVTWLTKRAGCKTADQAHHLIDGVAMAASVVTIGASIVNHYRAAFKIAPRFAARRAANLAKQAADKAAKAGTAPRQAGPVGTGLGSIPAGPVGAAT